MYHFMHFSFDPTFSTWCAFDKELNIRVFFVFFQKLFIEKNPSNSLSFNVRGQFNITGIVLQDNRNF